MLNDNVKERLILKVLGVSDESNPSQNQVGAGLIGKVCMFRTYSAGVHYGELVERDGKECLIKNSRRIFYWVKACSLSQLAMEGSGDFDGCKIAMEVPELFLSEVIEIIPMPDDVVRKFKDALIWKQ